jgi:D-aminopeptidase
MTSIIVLPAVLIAVGLGGWAAPARSVDDGQPPPAPPADPPGENKRPRAREAGVVVGVLPPGPGNAITDVAGVRVGHATLIRGEAVRTGVTAVLPHGGNLFREKVPGAVFVGNGFGKLTGSTQVQELGEIETPVLLTSTLNVPKVADALLDYVLALPGNEGVRSVNPVVAETNDGWLNDGRGRHVGRDDVLAAIRGAKGGPVEEGAVGAGTGTVAFGFKGGIGTASRRLPAAAGGYTVGVLVQTNYGGDLTIAGVPVGRELGIDPLGGLARPGRKGKGGAGPDGSVIVVIATDAPLDARNLGRLAARSVLGLARTGSWMSNGSGDYAIAFSTAADVRVRLPERGKEFEPRAIKVLSNDAMTPLFAAVVEATEEAVYNSLFRAVTTTGNGRTVEALPLDKTLDILRRHGALRTKE